MEAVRKQPISNVYCPVTMLSAITGIFETATFREPTRAHRTAGSAVARKHSLAKTAVDEWSQKCPTFATEYAKQIA